MVEGKVGSLETKVDRLESKVDDLQIKVELLVPLESQVTALERRPA